MLKMLLGKLSEDNLQYLLGLSLGLTEYEVKVLVCLAGGVCAPREIGETADIPRPKAYEVLNNLVKKGLASQSERKPVSYSLKEHALRDIISEVETKSSYLISTLRKLEEIRQVGLKASVEKDVTQVLKRLGFKDISVSETKEYITTESPQGFRVKIVFPQADVLSRDFRKRISDFRKNNTVRLVLVLASDEDAAKLEEANLRGIRPVEFGKGGFEESIWRILSELEMLDKEFKDKHRRIWSKKTDAQNTLSECVSLLEEVKILLKHPDGIPSEDLKRINDQVQSTQEEISRYYLQLHFLEEIMKTTISDFENHGATSWAELQDIEKLIENISSLEDRMQQTRKIIRALFNESKAIVDRREKLVFTPLSVQPPEIPNERYIIGQKKIKRILEQFIWSSKGLGGRSIGLLLGEHGSGKTLFLRYFAGKINGGDFGSAAAALTSVSDTFLDTYNSLSSMMASSLARISNRLDISLEFETQKSFADVMRRFPKFVDNLQDNGVMNLYWFIDEFDRLLRFSSEKRNVFLRELQVFLDEYADAPLTIVLALTPKSFENLRAEYPEILSRVPRSNVFRIPPIEIVDVKEMMSRLLARFGDSDRSALLAPDDEALGLLLSMSRGNPREVIQILNEGLYRALESGRRLDRGILRSLVWE